jgi:hypothetical protein
MGLEEAAKGVSVLATAFMGLGSVVSTLTMLAPMLGMSFTAAGIEISKAGVTA